MTNPTIEPRYAVLHSPETGHAVAVAFATEEGARVMSVRDYGIPRWITEPYRVRQRDLTEVIYRAGDPGYFDQALIELNRIAVIGERGELEENSEIGRLMVFAQEVSFGGVVPIKAQPLGASPWRARASRPVVMAEASVSSTNTEDAAQNAEFVVAA